jgi:hypothetical protein
MAYGFNIGTSGSWNESNNFDPENIDWSGSDTALPGGSWEAKPSDWGTSGTSDPKTDYLSLFKTVAGSLSKQLEKDKYRSQAESSKNPFDTSRRRQIGESGFAGEILPGVALYTPPRPDPFVINTGGGSKQKSGWGGTIGEIAGAGLGLALGGPVGMGIGAKLGGGIGGNFG